MALPFDWLDMPIKSILQFVKLNSEKEVVDYVNEYWKNPHLLSSAKHTDGTWFPHDIEFIDGTYKFIHGTKDKFTRRLARLINLLNTDAIFVFLTVMFEQSMYPASDYEVLKNVLREKTKGNALFITINLGNEPENYDHEHFNFVVPQIGKHDEGLKGWEKLICERIKEEIPATRE